MMNTISRVLMCFVLLSVDNIYMQARAEEVASCYLKTQIVTPHLLYLHTTNSSDDCSNDFEKELSVGYKASSSIAEGLVVEVIATLPGYGAYVVTFEVMNHSSRMDPTEWVLHEYRCWMTLQALTGFDMTQIHELDVDDHLKLEVESKTVSPEDKLARVIYHIPKRFWDIAVRFDDVSLFDIYTNKKNHFTRRTLSVDIWQRASSTALSMVTLQLIYCSANCSQCSLTTQISSQCPANKYLKFVYPETTKPKPFHLPVNYRPPSWLGIAIPISPHIYNADPSKPLRNTHYTISKQAVEFKQCAGRDNRSECNCSESMKTSTDISFSDCIQKVYLHPFEERFPFNLLLHLSNSSEVAVELPIQLQELNNRSDFTLKGEIDDSVITPDGKKLLMFHGPGLYHFQATVIGSASFCQLSTQFTVYVVSPPLQKAGEFSITSVTTIAFGVLTFAAYLIYHHIPSTHHHHHHV